MIQNGEKLKQTLQIQIGIFRQYLVKILDKFTQNCVTEEYSCKSISKNVLENEISIPGNHSSCKILEV